MRCRTLQRYEARRPIEVPDSNPAPCAFAAHFKKSDRLVQWVQHCCYMENDCVPEHSWQTALSRAPPPVPRSHALPYRCKSAMKYPAYTQLAVANERWYIVTSLWLVPAGHSDNLYFSVRAAISLVELILLYDYLMIHFHEVVIRHL
jgi:hypothetical protein